MPWNRLPILLRWRWGCTVYTYAWRRHLDGAGAPQSRFRKGFMGTQQHASGVPCKSIIFLLQPWVKERVRKRRSGRAPAAAVAVDQDFLGMSEVHALRVACSSVQGLGRQYPAGPRNMQAPRIPTESERQTRPSNPRNTQETSGTRRAGPDTADPEILNVHRTTSQLR